MKIGPYLLTKSNTPNMMKWTKHNLDLTTLDY